MKVVIESIGKVGSRARIGGHELVFDQSATVPGGEDRGPSDRLGSPSGRIIGAEAQTSYCSKRLTKWAA